MPAGNTVGVTEYMDEQPKADLRDFLNEVSSFSADETPAAPTRKAAAPPLVIGQVVEIAGSGSQIRLDAPAVMALQAHADPSVAMSGQVGSQVKTIVGNSGLIANVIVNLLAR